MTTAGPSHGSDCPHKSNPSAPHNEGVWRKFPTESQELRRQRRCYCACLFGAVSRNGSRPENVPPSLLRTGLANVDLCACVDCFMLQREKQFVASANERR